MRGCRGSRLKVNRAFHSPAMTEPAAALEKHLLEERKMATKGGVGRLAFPVASNVTGGWMQEKEEKAEGGAGSDSSPFLPSYWARHMRRPVLFRDNVAALRTRFPTAIFVECGPGNSLTKLRAKCLKSKVAAGTVDGPSIELMRHAKTGTDAAAAAQDSQVLVAALCKMWTLGVCGVDPTRENAVRGRRAHVPGYAFQKTVFWENAGASVYGELEGQDDEEEEEEEEMDEEEVAAGVEDDKCVGEKEGQGERKSSSSSRLVAISSSKGEKGDTRPLRIFCFPFAGGSARAFASSSAWATGRTLTRDVETFAVELPGRGARAEDPMMRDNETETAEVEAIAAEIVATKGESGLVLCGLSMGANFAVAVAHALIAAGHKECLEGVCVVGRAPPAPLAGGGQQRLNGYGG